MLLTITEVPPVLYTTFVVQWDGTGIVWNLAPTSAQNATLYGHEVQFLRYIMRIILDITTFIGLNRYGLSFIVSFMLIGLTVACRKVVATYCATKKMM